MDTDKTLKSLLWQFYNGFGASDYINKQELQRFKEKVEAAIADGFPIDYFDSSRSPGPLFYDVLSGGTLHEPFLELSVSDEYLEAVKFLLDKGASVNIKDSSGWTGLTHAAYYQGFRMPQELFLRIVEATENVNHIVKDYPFMDGGYLAPDSTALKLLAMNYVDHEDFRENCWENIKTLIDAGADLKVFNPKLDSVFLDFNEAQAESYSALTRRMFEYAYKERTIQVEDSKNSNCDYDYELSL